MGNRLWRQNTVATANGAAFDELYCYDRVNRLKEMQRGTLNGTQSAILSPVFSECWSMDSTANWSGYRQGTAPGDWNLVQQRSVNQVNEIVSFANSVGAAWATPAYDSAGNMTTFPKASDPTTAQSAVYDAWNRLVEVSEGSDIVAQYQYDGANRRTIQWSYSTGAFSETRDFYYTTPSQWQVVEERINGASTPERQFVWGLRYVDDLVLRDRDTDDDGVLDERLYALQDDNWNVTAIIDASGDVEERYAYSPFGVPLFLTNIFDPRAESSFDWQALFTGRRLDPETGLYDFRNRQLSPLLGSFLVKDPLEFPDGPNAYAAWFVPSYTDPLGLEIPGPNYDPFGTREWERQQSWRRDFNQFIRRNPHITDPDFAWVTWQRGCVGVVSCYVGRDVQRNSTLLNCFDSLADALAFQRTMSCSGTNQAGGLSQPVIFEVATKNAPLSDKQKAWERFDLNYYDQQNKCWLGANDAISYGGLPTKHTTEEQLKRKPTWYKQYCVVCQGAAY
jgi:RHS repeat-associated protein